MNIDEVQFNKNAYLGEDRLEVMYSTQNELRDSYGINLLDLDLPTDQQIAREFAWNVVEEMGEVLEVYHGTKDRSHILDELADSLSFYMELFQMCGFSYADLKPDVLDSVGDSLQDLYWVSKAESEITSIHSKFVEKLSLAINHLKNRKWRKTNLKTNEFTFKKALHETLPHFISFAVKLDISSDDLFEAYMRKAEVNRFRIRSKY